VGVLRSLPVALAKSFSKRSDLRNHRKQLICDRTVAYTGSFNLVDPRLFKSDSHVGEWIDIMMRIEGQMVDALACLFNTDYLLDEPGRDIGPHTLPPCLLPRGRMAGRQADDAIVTVGAGNGQFDDL
jgi:cardiolipin synthase